MTPTQHRAARALFERTWNENRAAKGWPEFSPGIGQKAQGVSVRETSYASPAAWAKNLPAMATSNNYGAITCAGPASPTCIPGVRDSKQTGEHYLAHFRAYPTPAEGVLDLFVHLMRQSTREAFLHGTATDLARAMYLSGYYSGLCPEAKKRFGDRAALESTSTTGKPALTSAGEACDEEAIGNYARGIKLAADEIAAAVGEEPIELDAVHAWPFLAVLGVAAAAAVGFYVWKTYVEPTPAKKTPSAYRRNAGRSEWKALYRSTCGEERDARRDVARDKGEARLLEAVKGDRRAATKARRTEARAAREAEAARARAEARRAALKAELAELRAEADEPCESAKADLVDRTREEKRAASERRSPKQREASRRTLTRLQEEIEREANEVETVIAREYGGDVGKTARRVFMKRGKFFVSEARRSGRGTTAAELGIEAISEDIENVRAELAEEVDEKSLDDHTAEELAYYEGLGETG